MVELDKQFDGLTGYVKELQIAQGLDAILIESSFDLADQKIECVFEDGKSAIDRKATKALMKEFLSGQSHKPRKPQSIRLRYRLADRAHSDSTPFKLGFKIFDTGIGIQLASVDRAGAEGIVDLATVWFDDQLSALSVTNPEAVYESAVPPVTLFCQ